MNNYPTYKLGEIAKIYNGNSINAEEKEKKYKGVDGRNYIGTKDIEFDCSVNYNNGVRIPFDEKKFKIAPAGSVLVCAEGGSAGKKSAFITEDVSFGNKLFAITNNQGLFDGKYVFYYTRYKRFFDLFKNELSGLIGGVSSKKFGEIPIPLPPLPTQHSIVSRIETLFAELDKAVQHLRTAQQQLKTYRQAVLKAAFEECDSYEKITNCFDVTGGLTKNSQREKFPIKMPYLRVANVYYNHLDLSEIKEIGIQESEVKEKLLKKDDLLFVEGNGSKEQIGRVAIWDGSVKNCLHQNHIIKGRPRGQVSSKYALYYLISDLGREQIVEVASSTSGLYTLSTDKVRNLKIPYIPLSEQQRIVKEIESRLSQATATETYIENALQQAEALRQSILKKAFSGELV